MKTTHHSDYAKRFLIICMLLVSMTNLLASVRDTSIRSEVKGDTVFSSDTAERMIINQDYPSNISEERNEETVSAQDFDRILTVRGESLVVKITGSNVFEILYTWPLNIPEQRISKNEVIEIIYKDGRREGFRAKEIEKKNEIKDWAVVTSEKDWERVLLVDSTANISDLVELGKVTARYEASKINASSDYLEKSALIILKKKAVRLGSNVILITDRKEYRAYGELPSLELYGTAYLKK